MNIRNYYSESTFKYTLISIILFGILSIFAIAIPNSMLLMFELMLFTFAFMLITLIVDPVAWMPFAVTHTVFANGFAIPISIVMARVIYTQGFILPNTTILVMLLIWWGSIIFHSVTSKAPILSYFGGIERQMGLTYRLTIPILLLVAWQVFYHMGYQTFYMILFVSALLEVMVLTLQFLDEQHYIKFPFTYMKTIGFRRYTGTLSNPIPVANFLLTILPLTLVFYKHDFLFFAIPYIIISWGLFLSHGRGSYIATSIITVLEIIFVAINPISPILTVIALLIITLPIILYLITPQGKAIKQRLLTTFNFIKSNPLNANAPSSSMNRIILWKEAVQTFLLHPLSGFGISNVARALRPNMSRRGARYFINQVVDSAHNYYLDLLMEGGMIHLEIYLLMLAISLYYSFAIGMPWLAIAIIGYSVDLFFSFPLQVNYLVFMLIISISSGFQMVYFTPLSYLVYAMIGLYFLNLYFSLKNNAAMRITQLGLSSQNHDAKITLDSVYTSMKIAPFEQRYFTVFSNILESLLSSGNLKLEDMHDFDNWFNSSRDFIIKNSEAADIPFATMGLIYAIVYANNKNKAFSDEAKKLIDISLKANPNSLAGKYADFVLSNNLGDNDVLNENVKEALVNFNKAEEILCDIIEDFINSPYRDFNLENIYWQNYFTILQKTSMNQKLKTYSDIYLERFKDILNKKEN